MDVTNRQKTSVSLGLMDPGCYLPQSVVTEDSIHLPKSSTSSQGCVCAAIMAPSLGLALL